MLSWSHYPESPPYPVSGCYRNQLHSFSKAGTNWHWKSDLVSGLQVDLILVTQGLFGKWPNQTAGCFVVNLGCASEVSTALCRVCQLTVGPAGYISIALESWDPATAHGCFYTPSARPACLSMSFEIFPQEILNNLQFWWVLGFLCSLLMHGLFSPPDDQHIPWEFTSPFSLCTFS